MMTLNQLCSKALKTANEHGFAENSVGEEICLMHSELSEALEEYRAARTPSEIYYEKKIVLGNGAEGIAVTMARSYPNSNGQEILNKPCGIPAEMADVLIRIFHFCGKYGIDLDKIVQEKMDYNDTRPYKHGGKSL
jgi:hypothetical protein